MFLSFFPIDKNLSEAWRVTGVETEHFDLILSGACILSCIWGNFFKVFFKVLKVGGFLSVQRNTHTSKQIQKNSKMNKWVYVCHIHTDTLMHTHKATFHLTFLLIIAKGQKSKILICCTSESNLLLSDAFGRREHSY